MIIEKIKEVLDMVRPGVDFEGKENLVENGLLDSLAIVTLVTELNDEFDIEISVLDMVPENFNSLETIAALVEKLANE